MPWIRTQPLSVSRGRQAGTDAVRSVSGMSVDGGESGWKAGDLVGHYRLESLLGRGGVGEVWSAADLKLGRRVALKRLRNVASGDPFRRERFLREAQVQARLDSPHLVKVFSVEELPDARGGVELILAMELVEGSTLADVLAEGPIGETRALEVLRQLAETLAIAHRSGVVHRDLKPSNLMLRPDESLVVLDFGLALLRPDGEGSREERLTGTGLVVGTASYMSPEQARGERVGPSTDVWACGVILYEMLSGVRPFAGASAMDEMVAVLRDDPRPLSAYTRSTSPALLRLVDLCLSKDAAGRPRDGDELLSRLPADRVPVAGDQTRLYAVEVLSRATAHDALTRRQARLALLGTLLGVVLMTAVAGSLWPPRSGETRLLSLAVATERAQAIVRSLGFAKSFPGVASGYLASADGAPLAWVRLAPTSLLDPRNPPSPGFPHPGEGEFRLLFDAGGRLLLYQRWPDETRDPVDPAPVLRESAEREGTDFQVVRRGDDLLRFGAPGLAAPEAERILLEPIASLVLASLTALAVAGALMRFRSPLVDLDGAVALAFVSFSVQVSKLLLNPRTIPGGIWWWVLTESIGIGLLVGLAYVAFEPTIRRTWPGMLPGWIRLTSVRKPDSVVGRELLLGTAALVPAGLALLVLTRLPGGAVETIWPKIVLFGVGQPGLYGFLLLDTLQLAIFAAAALLLLSGLLARFVKRSWVALALAALPVALAVIRPTNVEPRVLGMAAVLAATLTALGLRGGFLALVTFLIGATDLLAVPPLWRTAWTWPYAAAAPLLVLSIAVCGYWLSVRRVPTGPVPRAGPGPGRSDPETNDGSTVRTRRVEDDDLGSTGPTGVR